MTYIHVGHPYGAVVAMLQRSNLLGNFSQRCFTSYFHVTVPTNLSNFGVQVKTQTHKQTNHLMVVCLFGAPGGMNLGTGQKLSELLHSKTLKSTVGQNISVIYYS